MFHLIADLLGPIHPPAKITTDQLNNNRFLCFILYRLQPPITHIITAINCINGTKKSRPAQRNDRSNSTNRIGGYFGGTLYEEKSTTPVLLLLLLLETQSNN